MTDMLRIRGWVIVTVVTVMAITAGCHGVFDVSDPTLIRDQDIANASGANAQRLNASNVFMTSILSSARDVALFTDEWAMDMPSSTNSTINVNVQLDLRNSEALDVNGYVQHWGTLETAFQQTSIAIPAVRAYTPDSLRGDFLAQLYAMRGYLVLQMAEDLCSGFPLDDVVEGRSVLSGPLTGDSAIAYASVQLDSAVKYARDSARFVAFARVTKGRVLLEQGKYAEAMAMVASVPTTSVYATASGYRVKMNQVYRRNSVLIALGNGSGTTGQLFAAAHDPRIPVSVFGVSQTHPTDTLYITTLGQADTDVLLLASGVEARLIQAEVALNINQSWKPILDSLRATVGLDTLIDPGTTNGRVDLLYRERAFWLFMTGHRLGDLRRLITHYGRGAETVFPTGVYRSGGSVGTYGTATSIPFGVTRLAPYHPNLTSGCASQ